MLKKVITYEDFEGVKVSEEHYFHLSKAELVELEMSKKGGLSEWIKNIVASEDGAEIVSEFKKLILMAYGKKSPNGRQFIKNEELRQEFLNSPAYSEMFMEMVTNAGAAAEFVNGVIPHGLNEEVAKIARATQTPKAHPDVTPAPDPTRPVGQARPAVEPPRVLTKAEAIAMDADELQELLQNGATIVQSEV